MSAPVYTYRNPPPAPDRDLWWHAQRIAAPDTTDYVARHQRGVVILPFDLDSPRMPAGTVLPAWVCCDPVCGGVELHQLRLHQLHRCCEPHSSGKYRVIPVRQHEVGYQRVDFKGYRHGLFTAWWEPDGGAR